MMLEELQHRNYAQSTETAYILALKQFAACHQKSPDRPGSKIIIHPSSYDPAIKLLSVDPPPSRIGSNLPCAAKFPFKLRVIVLNQTT